jgi:hypothetical protein
MRKRNYYYKVRCEGGEFFDLPPKFNCERSANYMWFRRYNTAHDFCRELKSRGLEPYIEKWIKLSKCSPKYSESRTHRVITFLPNYD